MIEEALRKEIEKEAKRRTQGFRNQENCIQSYIMGASDFAEPREKRIEELEAKLAGEFEEKIKKPKIVNTLNHAVGYAFACGLSIGDAIIYGISNMIGVAIFFAMFAIFTGWLADSCFRDVKKVLEEKEESKNESRNES